MGRGSDRPHRDRRFPTHRTGQAFRRRYFALTLPSSRRRHARSTPKMYEHSKGHREEWGRSVLLLSPRPAVTAACATPHTPHHARAAVRTYFASVSPPVRARNVGCETGWMWWDTLVGPQVALNWNEDARVDPPGQPVAVGSARAGSWWLYLLPSHR